MPSFWGDTEQSPTSCARSPACATAPSQSAAGTVPSLPPGTELSLSPLSCSFPTASHAGPGLSKIKSVATVTRSRTAIYIKREKNIENISAVRRATLFFFCTGTGTAQERAECCPSPSTQQWGPRRHHKPPAPGDVPKKNTKVPAAARHVAFAHPQGARCAPGTGLGRRAPFPTAAAGTCGFLAPPTRSQS